MFLPAKHIFSFGAVWEWSCCKQFFLASNIMQYVWVPVTNSFLIDSEVTFKGAKRVVGVIIIFTNHAVGEK